MVRRDLCDARVRRWLVGQDEQDFPDEQDKYLVNPVNPVHLVPNFLLCAAFPEFLAPAIDLHSH